MRSTVNITSGVSKLCNPYDNLPFFNAYKSYRQRNNYLNDQIVDPYIHSKLGRIEGKRVLDIGCGFGQISKYCTDKGAIVDAIDSSMLMVNYASNLYRDINFQLRSLQAADFPHSSYEVIICSLMMHYIPNITPELNKIAKWLTADGQLIIIVNHPLHSGELEHITFNKKFCLEASHHNYHVEGERRHIWLGHPVVKYHRKLESYKKAINDSGMLLIEETQLYDTNKKAAPVFIAFESRKLQKEL